MSVLRGLVESAKSGAGCVGGDWEKFAECYPNLYELLQGQRNEEGQWLIGPSGFSLWVESGRWHCCIRPKFFAKVAFTSTDDVLSPFEGIEAQLAKGHFEWKDGKKAR